MFKRTLALVLSLTILVVIGSCGGSSSDSGTTTGTVTITGIATTIDGSIVTPTTLKELFYKAIPSGCPTTDAINAATSNDQIKMATKWVRLEKESSSDYYEITGCTNSTAADAETNEVTISETSSTICELGTTPTAAIVGTYDAISMAIYYVEMTIPMIVPQISATVGNYPLRMYFNDDDVQGILARDILIYDANESKWGWVDWNDLSTLIYVDEGRPTSAILDAFSNDDFWCDDCDTDPSACTSGRSCSGDSPTWEYKDPVVMSSEDTSTDVNISLSSPFSIASTAAATTINMSFSIGDVLTAWASAAQIAASETSIIEIGESCGFHPFFPDVTITTE